MSLAIDTIFIQALQKNADLMAAITASDKEDARPRLYGTSAPVPDEEVINVPVPYIIVSFDSLTNDGQTKDNPYEGDTDTVTIGVEITAETLDSLHDLTQEVRDTILNYMMENETDVLDYQFTASGIQYDGDKPCYWQVLNYQCDTTRDITDGEE